MPSAVNVCPSRIPVTDTVTVFVHRIGPQREDTLRPAVAIRRGASGAKRASATTQGKHDLNARHVLIILILHFNAQTAFRVSPLVALVGHPRSF